MLCILLELWGSMTVPAHVFYKNAVSSTGSLLDPLVDLQQIGARRGTPGQLLCLL